MGNTLNEMVWILYVKYSSYFWGKQREPIERRNSCWQLKVSHVLKLELKKSKKVFPIMASILEKKLFGEKLKTFSYSKYLIHCKQDLAFTEIHQQRLH